MMVVFEVVIMLMVLVLAVAVLVLMAPMVAESVLELIDLIKDRKGNREE